MRRFISALLAVVLLCSGGLSYRELSARAESAPAELLVDDPIELPPETPTEPSPTPTPEPTPSPVPTPSPTPTPTPEPSPEPSEEPMPDLELPPKPAASRIVEDVSVEPSGPRPGYYLMINVQANTVTAYTSDENGSYNQPYRAMVCSTGDATPTSGAYELGWRLRWQNLFGGVYGQYVTQIVGNILFHSVPYTKKYDQGSLEYWEFDTLGTSSSMGCVRLQVKDAKWIYDNFYSIVGAEFYTSSDPGPLGKPAAPQISGNERCRGWDPTDPDPNNPWLQPDPEATPAPEVPEGEIVIIVENEPAPPPAEEPAQLEEPAPAQVEEPAPAAEPEPPADPPAGDEIDVE